MSENILKQRFLEGLLPDPGTNRLVLLTGARQTGKTTLARYRYPELRYVNLDAPENRDFVAQTPTPTWARGVGCAVLDEAQKAPVVFEKVKYAFDAREITFSVLLGSSQILLLKRIRESLAGRVAVFELFPLMLCELLGGYPGSSLRAPLLDRFFSPGSVDRILSERPALLPPEKDVLSAEAEKYLLTWGGMPALLHLAEKERRKWLKDYTYTYLERDIGDLARLNDLAPFRSFQKLSALRSGKLLNFSELARDAGVSADTARRYVEYLKISYQAELLPPYRKNLTSRVVKTPKLYWLDIGLLRQLSGFTGDVYGELYETYVASELLKWIRSAQREGQLFFYRTRSGLEVDFFLETEWGIVGFEVKSRRKITGKDLRGLRAVREVLGDAWRGGVVVYLGDKLERLQNGIWAVPSRRLFSPE